MKGLFLLLILTILISSCASWGFDWRSDKQIETDRKSEYFSKHPDCSETDRQLIKEGKIRLGMTTEQVYASWGKPHDINELILENITSEQWVYYRQYLYFENNSLVAIQDR